jgi:tryptophan synthase alpha chain
MSRINSCLRQLREQGNGAFMPFLVIGDPNLETSLSATRALIEGGADILEFGLPFSDPPADGPIIQAASLRSLASGTTTDRAFQFLKTVRAEFDGPIVLLLYFNLIFRRGVDAFYGQAHDAGVDGILVADVPLEESPVLVQAAKRHQIDPIFIAAPTATEERLQQIGKVGSGFIYGVTRVGITGEQVSLNKELSASIATIKRNTHLPCLSGFGISTPDHSSEVMKAGSDGVICGSAIIRRIAENLDHPARMLNEISSFSQSMKATTNGALRL